MAPLDVFAMDGIRAITVPEQMSFFLPQELFD
jgi:hypothetical protein